MLVWSIAPVSVPVTPSNGTTTGIYVFYLCWYVGMINSTCISASNSEQWNAHRYLLCWLIFVMLVCSIAPVSVPVTPSNGTPTGIYFICVGWFCNVGMINSTCISASNSEQWNAHRYLLCWLIFVMLVCSIAPVSVPVTPSNGTPTGIYFMCWLIFVMLVWSIAPVSVPVTPSNGTPTGIYFVGWFL